MSSDINLEALDQLLADGAILIEVLPEGEFREEHLPDAINLPLKHLTSESVAHLDRASPIVVYCWDSL
jgi:phage shock protein E